MTSTTGSSMFSALPLEQLEEAAGELHRRAGSAIRQIGEAGADVADAEGVSPRERIASLIAGAELAGATLAAIAARQEPSVTRTDRESVTLSALMYGAPTVDGLLTRLEQDRRMLASLARRLEARLDEVVTSPWGHESPRALLIRQVIEEPARCAQALEALVAEHVDPESPSSESLE